MAVSVKKEMDEINGVVNKVSLNIDDIGGNSFTYEIIKSDEDNTYCVEFSFGEYQLYMNTEDVKKLGMIGDIIVNSIEQYKKLDKVETNCACSGNNIDY